MPTWGAIAQEINTLILAGNPHAFDIVRLKYLKALSDYTGRNTIIYASKWTTGDVPPNLTLITDEDVQAFMEAINGLPGTNLDLILHTGGGSAESADAIVSYLRAKFSDIRIIIPQAAMSAGTMMACAANSIIMGKHSSIGPVDPQFLLQTQVGIQAVPAHAILDQFKKAQEDCNINPKNLNSWLPMLSQYGPALLVQCENQIKFGEELIESWLKEYMFGDDKTSTKPSEIAAFLSNHNNFRTHGKHIGIEKAIEIGLKIERLEEHQDFQEKALSAFHATAHTLSGTLVTKITANQNGNSFIKMQNAQMQKGPRP